MERIVVIGETADVLGVSIATLRRWEAAGKLAAEHTAGGHRRDDIAKLSYARNCSVTPTPRSERPWLMRVSRRTIKGTILNGKSRSELYCAR
jgi:putative resolvase